MYWRLRAEGPAGIKRGQKDYDYDYCPHHGVKPGPASPLRA
ncbi:MAG: hypothetical protein JCHSAcid_06110 [uncultured Acidilobus sp. JCHS]|nr:MAG: hypothetical protein JCHSAcid_06110 [uncultured Acidilobus sp. JCHS]